VRSPADESTQPRWLKPAGSPIDRAPLPPLRAGEGWGGGSAV